MIPRSVLTTLVVVRCCRVIAARSEAKSGARGEARSEAREIDVRIKH